MIGFLIRKASFAATLAAAIGIPYVLMEDDWKSKVSAYLPSWSEKSEEKGLVDVDQLVAKVAAELSERVPRSANAAETDSADETETPQPAANSHPVSPTLVGAEIHQLRDVLRFDAHPRWVLSRWSRVSTVREDEFTVMRVPLVTGVELDDIAGSLTYYFDEEQVLQRIVFHGSTGDERKLAEVVKQAYKLEPEPSLRAGVYVSRWNGKPTSAMVVDMAPVVRAESPHERLRVHLEINRPRAYVQLSEPMNRLMASHKTPAKSWWW